MSTLDPGALRRAFGSFMTGITVVTSRDANGTPVGFTANSFTSVSLDPPLLLVCPGKSLSSWNSFANCERFAINILAEGQEDVSNTFASLKGDRFAAVPNEPDAHGIPLILGATARFSCSTHQIVDAGDHCVLIGKVDAFDHNEGPGLGYAGGRYFSLGLERDALESTAPRAVCGAILETGTHVLLEETPEGFRPPEICASDRTQLRQRLCDDLARRGLDVHLGAAYSVFDDANTHWAYFLATLPDTASNQDLTPVALGDLPGLTYASPPIADMMIRFALESRTRDFSLYLGDAQRGDVHSLPQRS